MQWGVGLAERADEKRIREENKVPCKIKRDPSSSLYYPSQHKINHPVDRSITMPTATTQNQSIDRSPCPPHDDTILHGTATQAPPGSPRRTTRRPRRCSPPSTARPPCGACAALPGPFRYIDIFIHLLFIFDGCIPPPPLIPSPTIPHPTPQKTNPTASSRRTPNSPSAPPPPPPPSPSRPPSMRPPPAPTA